MPDDLTLLGDSVAGWARVNAPVSAFRKFRDRPEPSRLATSVLNAAAAMGWTGALIPEEFGGYDLGFRGVGVILEELGRSLTPAPLIGSAVASAFALKSSASMALKQAWLPRIADGSIIAALAVDEGGRHDPDLTTTCAVRTPNGYSLTGSKSFVLEGMAADLFIVAAREASGETQADIGLFAVPTAAEGVSREARQIIDARGYAQVTLNQVEAPNGHRLNRDGEGRALLEQVLDAARAAVAAEALGLACQAFDTTVEYLKIRVQFGKPIGAFQALQHRAVEMFGQIQLARGLVETALDALDTDPASAAVRVSAAKAAVGDLANLVTREMIQLHGGIAMTDDHDAGLYLKRARVLEATFGGAAFHRERFARLMNF